MNADNTTDTTEPRTSSAIEADCSDDMLLHECDVDEASEQSSAGQCAADDEPSTLKPVTPREWTIQSYRVDRWVDDTRQETPYTFEEMQDALARCELLHFNVRHRGYNHLRRKSYEPM